MRGMLRGTCNKMCGNVQAKKSETRKGVRAAVVNA